MTVKWWFALKTPDWLLLEKPTLRNSGSRASPNRNCSDRAGTPGTQIILPEAPAGGLLLRLLPGSFPWPRPVTGADPSASRPDIADYSDSSHPGAGILPVRITAAYGRTPSRNMSSPGRSETVRPCWTAPMERISAPPIKSNRLKFHILKRSKKNRAN